MPHATQSTGSVCVSQGIRDSSVKKVSVLVVIVIVSIMFIMIIVLNDN